VSLARALLAALLALGAPGCIPDTWTFPAAAARDAAGDGAVDAALDAALLDAAADVPVGDSPCELGPVAHYRGEGNARDETGQHDGTLHNGVTFVPGRFGRAFHIEGPQQYVELPSAIADFGEGDFTIAMWFRTTDGGVQLARRAQCANGPPMLGEDLGVSPYGHVAVEMFTSIGYFVLRTAPGHNDGAWHFTALVRHGDRLTLTLDGRTEDAHAIVGTFSDPAHTPTFLGFSRCIVGAPGSNGTNDPRTWYRGDLDEVAFYNRALTDAELGDIVAGRCAP
jgi:Concanavalin A-like lectin/glucanases superfamily